MPDGYSSELTLKAAFAFGQVKLIELPKSIPADITEYKDIEYANVDGRSLQLNLYVPKGITKPTPCLVFIHGGGWSKGNKDDYLFYNLAFAKKGYITASLGYRLSGVAKFPAAVHDVKCGVRWLRAHAEKYHIDPEKLVAIGGSAGGHLAMMVGYSDDPQLEGELGYADQSSRVRAVVNFYGVADSTTQKAKDAHQVQGFIGGTYDEKPKMYHLNSPMEHLTADDPPTLTFHGSIDELVPVSQATHLHEKLDELGIENQLDVLVGWPHTMDLQVDVNRRCQFIIGEFLKKYAPLPE
ncbi:MAG: alpha/beta hydrolase [Planctomycetaceae bacterium]